MRLEAIQTAVVGLGGLFFGLSGLFGVDCALSANRIASPMSSESFVSMPLSRCWCYYCGNEL